MFKYWFHAHHPLPSPLTLNWNTLFSSKNSYEFIFVQGSNFLRFFYFMLFNTLFLYWFVLLLWKCQEHYYYYCLSSYWVKLPHLKSTPPLQTRWGSLNNSVIANYVFDSANTHFYFENEWLNDVFAEHKGQSFLKRMHVEFVLKRLTIDIIWALF